MNLNTFNYVEIYPYKKSSKPKTKKINFDKVCNSTELLEFVNESYINLIKDSTSDEVLMKTLEKMLEITKSTDGFIAVYDNKIFNYHTVIINASGISLKSNNHSEVDISNDSLLSRSITKKKSVISNDLNSDPRKSKTKKIPPVHPELKTFLGIPLIKNDEVFGQIGLSNSDKYTTKDIENIIPLVYFVTNYFWASRHGISLSHSQEALMKNEVIALKDSFVANMSHELRTPLNGIVGMTRLLSESANLNPTQKGYINILSECSVQLMELVNDILDFSKLSSGNLTLNNHQFNLRKTINNAIAIVHQRIMEKKLELSININTIPEFIYGDSRRLKQILINLLGNANKFTSVGGITVNVNSELISSKPIKKYKIYFEVKDTGCGIKKGDQEKIFNVFTKLQQDDEDPFTAGSPGAGLGLSISKELVNLMGGEITVESDGKNGSTFKFWILTEDDTELKEGIEQHLSHFKGKKVIIVDDNEDNRIFLMNLFYSWGFQVQSFSSAKETLTGYINLKQEFDIAIIDICMPVMGGVQLAQNIRELGITKPIIGLSSIGHDIQGKDWFDLFTTKPVSKSILFNMVVKCLLEDVPRERKNTQGKIDTIILIAEDDTYNQILLNEMLKSLGYTDITIVPDGKKCVEAVKKRKFDVCLMDIKMPVMDGLTATRHIKKLDNPPTVIAVSASVLESDRSLFYSAGMDGYIPKPIDKDRLARTLAEIKNK